jgi:tetratricopeptide (TPR) repeat protein
VEERESPKKGENSAERAESAQSGKGERTPAEIYLDSGAVCEAEERLDDALHAYRKALKCDPSNSVAHGRLGRLLLRKGSLEEAFESLQSAKELDPESAEIRFDLGRALSRRGDAQAAIEEFRQALRLRADYAEAMCALGLQCRQEKLLKEAMVQLKLATKHKPDYAPAYYGLALVQEDTEDREAAVRRLRRAVRCADGFREARVELGRILLEEGYVKDAIRELKRAAVREAGPFFPELAPVDARREVDVATEARVLLGKAYMKTDSRERAVRVLEEAREEVPELPDPYYQLALLLAKAEPKKAITYMERFLDLAGSGDERRSTAGAIVRRLKQMSGMTKKVPSPAEGKTPARPGTPGRPGTPARESATSEGAKRVSVGEAQEMERRRRAEEAKRKREEARRREERERRQQEEARRQQEEARKKEEEARKKEEEARKKEEEARKKQEKAREKQEPGRDEGQREQDLRRSEEARGKGATAETATAPSDGGERAEGKGKKKRRPVSWREAVGRAVSAMKKDGSGKKGKSLTLKELMARAQAGIVEPPVGPEKPEDKALPPVEEALSPEELAAEAAELEERLVKAPDPKDQTRLAEIRLQQGQVDEAIGLFRRALEEGGETAELHNGLGCAYLKRGDPKTAIDAFRKAVDLDPHYEKACSNLAFAYREAGMYRDADRQTLRLSRLQDKNRLRVKNHLDRGYKRFVDDAFDAALEEYRAALAIDPRCALAYNRMGNVYGKMGRAEDAIEAYRNATVAAPKDVTGFVNLGTAYRNLGLHGEAIKAYEGVLEIDPDDMAALTSLAHLYLATDRFDEAEGAFNRVIRGYPRNAQLHAKLAAVYQRKGDLEKAAGEFKKAVRYDPKDVNCCIALGNLYVDLERFDDALEVFQKAAAAAPGQPDPYYNLACFYSLRGEVDKGFLELERALEFGFDRVDWLERDRDLENLRRDERFKALVTRLDDRPGSPSPS